MTTALAARLQLGPSFPPVTAAQLPAVIDIAAVKSSIARAFELAVTLDRRFALVLTGKGLRVDELPTVALAASVRVGDGTLEGALPHLAKRALLFATPASIALLTGFGAADVSDLALIIAGLAPFTWVPAQAIRSFRAERAAKRDIARAAVTRATEADLEPIKTFVRQIAEHHDPRLDAVARMLINLWTQEAQTDESIEPATGLTLTTLRDELPAPPAELVLQARRLVDLARLAQTIAAEQDVRASHLAILKQSLSGLADNERDALMLSLRRMLQSAGQHVLTRLPSVTLEKPPPEPLDIKFADATRRNP